MSNRLLSFLILFVIFGSLIGGYMYFFVYYTGSLILSGNQGDFVVKLYNNTIKKTIEKKCEKNICEIEKLPPLDFTITISKDGFKDFVSQVSISRNKKSNFKFFLKKQSFLIEQKNETNTNTGVQNKIEELRKLGKIKSSYAYFDLGELGIFYFEESTGSLSLYSYSSGETNKIYDIESTLKENINLKKVYSTQKEIFIEAGNKKYIYNLSTGNVIEFEIKIPILYVKKADILGNYQIVTEKGTFLYTKNNSKLEYIPIFFDYVNYGENGYIGIIYKNEYDKKRNYEINGENNLIIYYNFLTKEKKILLDTPISISKIIKENENIYFYDENNKKYLLNIGE